MFYIYSLQTQTGIAMKQLITVALIITSLLSSCNNRGKKTASEAPAATSAEIQEAVSEAQQKTEELQQLTAYTPEEVRDLLPAELAGDSASKLSAYTNMGTGFGTAEYHPTDSTSIELSVFDCAGSAGAGIYNTQFINQLANQSGSTKTIEFKGGKAIEYSSKNNSSLTWLANERLLVIAEGRNMRIEELKEIAGSLKLK